MWIISFLFLKIIWQWLFFFFLQWDLVCSKAGMGEMTQSLFIAGQGVGALLFPSLADHFGRKPIHILSLFIMMLSALISSVAPNYWVYAPTRFFCGVCQQVLIFPFFLFTLESSNLMWGVYLLTFQRWKSIFSRSNLTSTSCLKLVSIYLS